MSLQRLIEEGRTLDNDAREIGGPSWRERRIAWLCKEMASALPTEDWRGLGLDPALAIPSSTLDVDVRYIQVRIGDFSAFLDDRGVCIAYYKSNPIRLLQGMHCHHPIENHRQLVLWLADIFPATEKEPTHE